MKRLIFLLLITPLIIGCLGETPEQSRPVDGGISISEAEDDLTSIDQDLNEIAALIEELDEIDAIDLEELTESDFQ
ncbi:MAG: hypothetical protein ABID38_07205 [Candidatus Diapherotrites archaeon]